MTAPLAARLAPLGAVVFAMACTARPAEPDLFAPASEPRATLHLQVDLARGQRCAETFDLALYQDRSVELVEWDEGLPHASRCEARAITVRYLPRRASAEDVRRAVARAGGTIVADLGSEDGLKGDAR